MPIHLRCSAALESRGPQGSTWPRLVLFAGLAGLFAGCFNAGHWYGEVTVAPPGKKLSSCADPADAKANIEVIADRASELRKGLTPGQRDMMVQHCDERVVAALFLHGVAETHIHRERVIDLARKEQGASRPLGELLEVTMMSPPPPDPRYRSAGTRGTPFEEQVYWGLTPSFVWHQLLSTQGFGSQPADRALFERAEAIARDQKITLPDPFEWAIRQWNASALDALFAWERKPSDQIWTWLERVACRPKHYPKEELICYPEARHPIGPTNPAVQSKVQMLLSVLRMDIDPPKSLCLGDPAFLLHARELMDRGVNPATPAPHCHQQFGNPLWRIFGPYEHEAFLAGKSPNNSDFELAELLVRRRAPLYNTVLSDAMRQGPESLALALLHRGASARLGEQCNTPLHLAVRRGFENALAVMLKRRENLSLSGPYADRCVGDTAYESAGGDAGLAKGLPMPRLLAAAGAVETAPTERAAFRRASDANRRQELAMREEARKEREREQREIQREEREREAQRAAEKAAQEAATQADIRANEAKRAQMRAEMDAAEARNRAAERPSSWTAPPMRTPVVVPSSSAPARSSSAGTSASGAGTKPANTGSSGGASCETKKWQCESACKSKARACSIVPVTGIVTQPGAEPAKTLITTMEASGVGQTSKNAFGWLPTREGAARQALDGARMEAEKACRSASHTFKKILWSKEDRCESKREMTTEQWNCVYAAKIHCEREVPNPAHAEWKERVKRSEVEGRDLAKRSAEHEQCHKQRQQQLDLCASSCNSCR